MVIALGVLGVLLLSRTPYNSTICMLDKVTAVAAVVVLVSEKLFNQVLRLPIENKCWCEGSDAPDKTQEYGV